ncbi:MAG TPA: aldo/keto reductase [Gaiellales bacterium]|nr:aldo/keto reductase [Gaiellales bacterium]
MQPTVQLGSTGIAVSPLCLGGNVFGWTADEESSTAVLDAYVAAGGNFIDTADGYGDWVEGNPAGMSERILGRWMAGRGNRDELVIATKVGRARDMRGLAAETIRKGAEASLERLGTDRIDLYYAHADDPSTPLEETMAAFDALVREGKVRHVAASNYSAARLAEALRVSDRDGLARYAALQPEYNLVSRDGYEGGLQELCVSEGLACLPYSALASGFLTGKYRPGGPEVEGARAASAGRHLEGRAGVLDALDEVAAAHSAPVSAVALAWLLAQPGVTAPIASARTPEQLAELLPMAELELSPEELEQLGEA